ncbi:unnamed protein product [Phyllotreta striolata]|uniref:Peroxisomal ATPase PEX6 n=1 Tax=Phyllotreta striolata TaxID=444603 RepID=A0A9N9TYG9_PHYSR|nr:unnamed protein product [Phyllotreta striolata]
MANNTQLSHCKIIFAIARWLYPKTHPFWFTFYMYLCYLRTIKRRIRYKIQPVPIEFIKATVHDRVQFKDINRAVLVHPRNVYITDKASRLYCDETKNHTIVYPIPTSVCEENELLVSETFYYNSIELGLSDDVRLLNCDLNSTKFAEEVSLSLVNSPFDINTSLSDALLERFFEAPKLLRKNELIEVDIAQFAEVVRYANNKANNIGSVFYKCNKMFRDSEEVTSDSMYCVIGETAIKQAANIQSFIPKRSCKMVMCGEIAVKIPAVPCGLGKYFERIERATKPFLKKLKLPLKPAFLVVGNAGSGKDLLVSSLADRLGMHHYKIDNFELMGNVYAQNETKLHNAFFNAKMAAPCLVSMHNFEHFGKNNDGQYDERIAGNFADELNILFENNSLPILLFCCTDQDTIPSNLRKSFLETFEIRAPTGDERAEALKWITAGCKLDSGVDFDEIAQKTHGFFYEDLKALIYYARKRSECINQDKLTQAVEYMQKSYNRSIGAAKVPKVLWTDVGGLTEVKQEIIKTINLPLKHPDFVKKTGLKRSGILLFGPPGTGKTLIAKAVATECNLCFLSVKGPELLNMYVGQSEQNIREVFQRAREASPCIIFFDELDSLAPNRGISGDSGGVMDRVVSQLLAEMDGLNESGTIFIIGATNRPDLIDPALLRPGRFDKLLYIGPCTDDQSKISVLRALTKRFNLDKDVNLEEIVGVCPKNITGADFYGICSNAWLEAARRLVNSIENGLVSSDDVTAEDVVVGFNDFKSSLVDVKPSINPRELVYFEKLKNELCSNT